MSIQTDEEFERACQKAAERRGYLATICENLMHRFKPSCRLHEVLMFQIDATLYVRVFFKTQSDVEEYKVKGMFDAIKSFVYDEFERYGIGKRPDMTVIFEWDSDERVRKSIPTDEEFAEADRLEAERDRHLDTISENVLRRFKQVCRLHDVWLFPEREMRFRAYVFFQTPADIEEYKANGVLDAIMSFVYDELERYGRGKRSEITVVFELDSDERVQKDFGGDYWARLH